MVDSFYRSYDSSAELVSIVWHKSCLTEKALRHNEWIRLITEHRLYGRCWGPGQKDSQLYLMKLLWHKRLGRQFQPKPDANTPPPYTMGKTLYTYCLYKNAVVLQVQGKLKEFPYPITSMIIDPVNRNLLDSQSCIRITYCCPLMSWDWECWWPAWIGSAACYPYVFCCRLSRWACGAAVDGNCSQRRTASVVMGSEVALSSS